MTRHELAVDVMLARRAVVRDGDVSPVIRRNRPAVEEAGGALDVRTQRRSADSHPPRLRPGLAGDARAGAGVRAVHPRFEGEAVGEVERAAVRDLDEAVAGAFDEVCREG